MSIDSASEMVDLSELRIVQLSRYTKPDSDLIVAEVERHVPAPIKRVFTIRAESNVIRGKHAHRRCTQVLICLHGAVKVECDDGFNRQEIELDRPDRALLIPPSLWTEQIYLASPTILLVLCDRVFEEEDYIRDREEFQQYRAMVGASKKVGES